MTLYKLVYRARQVSCNFENLHSGNLYQRFRVAWLKCCLKYVSKCTCLCFEYYEYSPWSKRADQHYGQHLMLIYFSTHRSIHNLRLRGLEVHSSRF